MQAKWVVIYKDRSQHWHLNNDSDDFFYKDIDREQLEEFVFFLGDKQIMRVDFSDGDGQHLVYLRRVQMIAGQGETEFYILGKKKRFMCLITASGEISIYNNFKESALLSEPNWDNPEHGTHPDQLEG